MPNIAPIFTVPSSFFFLRACLSSAMLTRFFCSNIQLMATAMSVNDVSKLTVWVPSKASIVAQQLQFNKQELSPQNEDRVQKESSGRAEVDQIAPTNNFR
mmetsp:Transcript_47720/g.83510  ORF Transcript_47720/g.83510 Transcript_47720/m.83510 type:complete len:100 (+) Transcript_47720:319-618(+)